MKISTSHSTDQLLNGQKTRCYHCGESCPTNDICINQKVFCCNGCKLVYELLSEKDLCAYYTLDKAPGISPGDAPLKSRFAYLEDPVVVNQLISFSDETRSRVIFRAPAMHCASCIWLLENLYRVNTDISESKVNFLRKEITITFNHKNVSLREIVELLTSIGYEPEINLASLKEQVSKETDKQLYIKLGIAGFAFGNIMLLSFPEYLAGEGEIDSTFRFFFGVLNIVLALPVFFYSSSDYFKSAYQGIKHRMVNMDIPISLGIVALFLRSLVEIITRSGAGYMDSFTGLVFLLLIGKIFQKKTYDTLSFERDYRSYFPVSVLKKTKEEEKAVLIANLKINDRILVRNQELIPADSVLIKGSGNIDYSFVTGESTPVTRKSGDLVYAGGRQKGEMLELEIVREVSQSYLTQLWNKEDFTKTSARSITTLANSVSKYFTAIVLLIAFLSGGYWLQTDLLRALNAFTSVLIIACPCALALSTPFTLGNTMRIFGKNAFYLKNSGVVENLAQIEHIIFDKTGTITSAGSAAVEFFACNSTNSGLTDTELLYIKSMASQSTHPLSQHLTARFSGLHGRPVDNFSEEPGMGISGQIDGHTIRMGSAAFLGADDDLGQPKLASQVHVEIDGQVRGHFLILNKYRAGLQKVIDKLSANFQVSMLTGDNESEKGNLKKIFRTGSQLLFNQDPFDKLNYVRDLISTKRKVLMIGDGLNDAGALRNSHVGITISEDVNTFSPASDGILDANKFQYLPDFIQFAKISRNVIILSFLISFLYNVVGLSFAVGGNLSPLIAAILMPLSSVSVILFTTGMTTVAAKKLGFRLKA